MKIRKDLNFTYKGYLQESWSNPEGADELTIATLSQLFTNISNVKNSSLPAFFIIDYSQNILIKTNTKNIAQLITCGVRNKLI